MTGNYPAGGLFHRRLPPDATIRTRRPVPPETKDKEVLDPLVFVANGLNRLREQIGEIARQVENRRYAVDEYQSETLAADSQTIVTIMPTYEYWPEKIETIIVNGPPAGAFNLQLGDRLWSLIMPASGILILGPLGIILGRNDPRILTAGAAGDWFLELTGLSDQRYSI